MTTTVLAVVAVLYGVGMYLLTQRVLTRVIVGLALVSHGANLLLLVAGGPPGKEPLLRDDFVGAEQLSDPLPQALVLTAIVISFGVIAFVLALALRSWALTRNDEVEDDVEDRRIARHLPYEDYTADGADRPPVELQKEPE